MTFHHWFLYVLVIVTLIGVPGPSAVLCLTHGADTVGDVRLLLLLVVYWLL